VKAIIEIVPRGSIFDAALADLAAGGSPDYYLSFESAKGLFSEITPARLDLLDALRRAGPCSVYALAKATGRNYSNVHADITKLIDLNLVERTHDDTVCVPFEAIEIRMVLARAA
jgi:predicted transcriptional regulator